MTEETEEQCTTQHVAKQIASNPVEHPSFDQFVATIAALRAPDGCPWDKEQTHASIAHNMIEEAYEAADAIEQDDVAHMREELGDVLLQVVLQSQIAADAGEFTIDDVAADVNAKMVRRHPHVFGEADACDAGEVLDLWDQVKMAERANAERANAQGQTNAQGQANAQGQTNPQDDDSPAQVEGLLDGVPVSFPALLQAQKISRKAVAAGFEWDTLGDVWDQVNSEIAELNEAYAAAPKNSKGKVEGNTPEAAAVEDEFGDVLFSLVNVGRKMGVDAEGSLRACCRKFRNRWALMEQTARQEGRDIAEYSTAELNEMWAQAKVALSTSAIKEAHAAENAIE